jgi:hypothetical protein
MKENYPELGNPGGKKHPEGAEITHPSGAIYKRVNGNWVLVRKLLLVSWLLMASPAWGQSLGWTELSGTTLNDVCAATHGFPDILQNGCVKIYEAWNSAVLDPANNYLYIWGGGHNDYDGNEVYRVAVTSQSAGALTRVNDPTYPATPDCSEAYDDDRPSARHTGDGLEWITHLGIMFSKNGSYDCESGGQTYGTWTWNPSGAVGSGGWEAKTAGQSGGTTSLTAYDLDTRKVYVITGGASESPRLHTYTQETAAASGTWATLLNPIGAADGVFSSPHSSNITIDSKRRKIVALVNDDIHTMLLDSPYTYAVPTVSGTTSCDGADGIEYDPVRDRIVCWGGGNTVNLLNMDTGEWTQEVYTGGPTPSGTEGVFGRFRYLPQLGIYIACVSTAENCYTLRLTASNTQLEDYYRRALRPGVIRTANFDVAEDFSTGNAGAGGAQGSPRGKGLIPSFGTDFSQMTQDTSTKASGAGSLKFTIASESGASAGAFGINFSYDFARRMESGETVYIQFRQRFSPCFMFQGTSDANCLANGTPREYEDAGGPKQAIFGAGDQAGCTLSNQIAVDNSGFCEYTCTPHEIVQQNSGNSGGGTPGAPQMYHNCGIYEAFTQNVGGDIRLQNAYSPTYCSYNADISDCFPYYVNEWMTFMIQVTLGTRDSDSYPNSTVRQWVAREGEEPVLLQEYTTKDLLASSDTNRKYGKVWLLPYNTDKNDTEVHPEAYVWYDELIISSQSIPFPGVAAGDGAPAAPTGLTITRRWR